MEPVPKHVQLVQKKKTVTANWNYSSCQRRRANSGPKRRRRGRRRRRRKRRRMDISMAHDSQPNLRSNASYKKVQKNV